MPPFSCTVPCPASCSLPPTSPCLSFSMHTNWLAGLLLCPWRHLLWHTQEAATCSEDLQSHFNHHRFVTLIQTQRKSKTKGQWISMWWLMGCGLGLRRWWWWDPRAPSHGCVICCQPWFCEVCECWVGWKSSAQIMKLQYYVPTVF